MTVKQLRGLRKAGRLTVPEVAAKAKVAPISIYIYETSKKAKPSQEFTDKWYAAIETLLLRQEAKIVDTLDSLGLRGLDAQSQLP